MTDKPKALPPDDDLRNLALFINAQVPAGMRVDFYRFEHPEGYTETGIVFQCGDRRSAHRTRTILGQGDAPDLVRSLTSWVAKVAYSARWSEDPRDAA